jgi:hypothetical protein
MKMKNLEMNDVKNLTLQGKTLYDLKIKEMTSINGGLAGPLHWSPMLRAGLFSRWMIVNADTVMIA